MNRAKITPHHLERLAVVYVRQSTPMQVRAHQESTLRQYALGERAQEFGWPAVRIRTIDADLGTGAGEKVQGKRDGFRELCALIARDQVGGVFGIEVSRLARNTIEWFQLLDLCRRHDTVLIEDSHIYCPSRDDDSLVLGIKGTVSAAELSLIRARMEGGKRNKALRGALYSSRIPIGFVRDGETLRKDPDARIQAAIATVFARFRQAGSARQATMLLQEAGEDIPRRQQPGALVEWGSARYEQVNRILTSPAMGGAYAYGFKRGVGHGAPLRPVLERWDILIPEKHEGYVSWPEWLAVQEQLARNHRSPDGARGAREGRALLQGLTVCGGCGLSMSVSYNRTGWVYGCNKRDAARRRGGCWSAGGKRIDAAVGRLFLDAITPAGLEAARQAARDGAERERGALRRWELDLEHCRYQVGLAERRYRQVDPDNRLIAATLERDWELALRTEKAAGDALEAARARQPAVPDPALLDGLGASLSRVWERAAMRDRKRLLACLVDEVTIEVARDAREITTTVHWHGGHIDEFVLPMLSGKPTPRRDDRSTVELVRNLSCFYTDREIAKILTRQGRRTAHGLDFSVALVGNLRRRRGIAPYRPERDGEAPLLMGVGDVAAEIGVSDDTLYRWIRQGLVPVAQPDIAGAPVRIRMTPALRERFRTAAPEGFVPLAMAIDRLRVTRQTVWERIKAGELDSCHVTHGKRRGLYVRLPVEDEMPLLRRLIDDAVA